ncbi:protein-lysine N-methyltransferase EEF2KMT-like [Penaeus indicus]|uniref:protein-lysine N-methyltransferase EEF2KMT-like n=1 Tax=Penaeus indicus TaxID=29960 RepID=UPI00300D6818
MTDIDFFRKVSQAYLAGMGTSSLLWQYVKYGLDDVELPPSDIAARMVQALQHHPRSAVAPREAALGRNVLQWMKEEWAERGWTLPPTPLDDLPPTEPLAVSYKTYLGWGRGRSLDDGVTLLESSGGITHNTTGMMTWSGAAVLAEWTTENPELLAGRRVLELGAGAGFTAAVLLTTPPERLGPPRAYTATDCNHHVLALLHHNLHINVAAEQPACEELAAFQQELDRALAAEDDADSEEVKPWTPPLQECHPGGATVVPGCDLGGDGWKTEVGVMQLDWCRPCPLPPVDVVVAADVVYAHSLIPPLLALIRSILQSPASDLPPGAPPGETPGEKAAYIACTRRTHETMGVFLEEVARQGLAYKQIYQSSLDIHHAVFSINETHRPVKVFKITLTSE